MELNSLKDSGGDKLFNLVNYSVLSLLLIVMLYPLIYILSASFSSSQAVMSGEVWLWPVKPTLDGYRAVFEHRLIWSGYRNSILYTALGTFINVIMTLLAAYPLARKDFYGKNLFLFLFVFTTLFSGGLIPTYLLIKELGMLNSVWAMVLPGALSIWNVMITRTYLQTTVPEQLLEAAKLDGCGDFAYLWRIVLPLSGPILAVITLYYAVGHWNQYFGAMIYLKDQSLYPLQLVLRDVLIRNEIDLTMISDMEEAERIEGIRWLLKYSLIVVSSAPMMLLYPFIQKHFVRGVMIGSLKE